MGTNGPSGPPLASARRCYLLLACACVVLVSLWGLPSAVTPSPSHAGAVSSDEVLGILPDLSALKCEASPACAQQQASTVRAAMNLAHFNPTVRAYWHKWNNSASVQPPLYRRALRECRRPLCGGAWLCAGAGLARCRRCPLRPSPLSSRFWEFAEPVKEPLWEARKKKWIVITSIAPPTEDIRAWTKLGDWAIVVVSEGSAPAGSVGPRICTTAAAACPPARGAYPTPTHPTRPRTPWPARRRWVTTRARPSGKWMA